MNLVDHLTKEQKEIEAKLAEIERLKRLQAAFPDLVRHVGRWDKVAYSSPSVNGRVDRFEQRYNCGCCNDSPLELWPYLETPDGKVYSSPACFRIGEKEPFTGRAVPVYGWRDQLKAAGLPDQLIEQAGMRFEEERERARQLVEDAFKEPGEEPEPLL